MQLSDHLRQLTPDGRQALADRCETSVGYLYQLAGGHRTPSLGLIELIEAGTERQVTRYDWPVKRDKQQRAAA